MKIFSPATSANLGPHFDCLGLAVDIWNETCISLSDDYKFEINGEGADSLPRDQRNFISTSIKRVFEQYSDIATPIVECVCHNNIPNCRGLGSSSAAIVTGVLAGRELLKLLNKDGDRRGTERIDDFDLFNTACEQEGHADNIAPAFYGGMQLCYSSYNNQFFTHQIKIKHKIKIILFVPNKELSTTTARNILPTNISKEDAIFNISRSSLFIAAILSGDLEFLQEGMEDRLHQTYRERQNPHLFPVIKAAREQGALGASLSGAGPTVVVLCNEKDESKIIKSIGQTSKRVGVPGRVLATQVSTKGAFVELE